MITNENDSIRSIKLDADEDDLHLEPEANSLNSISIENNDFGVIKEEPEEKPEEETEEETIEEEIVEEKEHKYTENLPKCEKNDKEYKANTATYLEIQAQIGKLEIKQIQEPEEDYDEKLENIKNIKNVATNLMKKSLCFGSENSRKKLRQKIDETCLILIKSGYTQNKDNLKNSKEIENIQRILKINEGIDLLESILTPNSESNNEAE